MNAKYPRLLVATEWPLNGRGGGPAVLRQTLNDWPLQNLFWWSCQYSPQNGFGQKVSNHHVAVIPPKLYPNRRLCSLKCWFLDHFWGRWATRHLRATIYKVQPDVIWVIPQGLAIPPLHEVLPTVNINYHISIQDYPDIRGNIAKFGLDRCRKLAVMTDDLYAKAASRDAICRPMVADLQARTGCTGDVWHAGIEQEDIDYVADKTETHSDKIRIAYAGSIIAEETFEFVVTVLTRIRHKLSQPLSLELFGGQSHRTRRWFDPLWMVEHNIMPDAQLVGELRKCTWGLTVMSLTDEDPRYSRFSFPTKTITYLGAGLPILAVGHPESSLIKMAGAYSVGLCTSTNDGNKLQQQFLAVLAESQPFLKYKEEILRCISTEYEMPRLRKNLYNRLFNCAQNWQTKAN